MPTDRGSAHWLEGMQRWGETLTARSAAMACLAVATLLTGACGSGDRTPRGFATATATPTGDATETSTSVAPTDPEPTFQLPRDWVAVFRVAEVEHLDDETQEFMRLVPHNIAIAPIGCWVGVPERLGNPEGDSVYVAAVVADSREELEEVIEKVGREPILVGEFPAMCVD